MFESLKSFFQRRKDRNDLRSIFSELSKEEVDALLSQREIIPLLTEKNIDFVYATVFAPTVETFCERVSMVAELADQHQGLVNKLVPISIVGFGEIPCKPAPPADACARFIASLRTRLPDSVAIVHGSAKVSAGSFGTNHRLEWSFWWPGAPKALQLLGTLGPGEIYEVLPDE